MLPPPSLASLMVLRVPMQALPREERATEPPPTLALNDVKEAA